MFLQLNVDQHGITPITLFCEMEDTGSLSIDATLEDRNFKALFPGGRGVEIRAGGGKKDQNGGIRNFRLHKRPYRTPQG